MREEPLDAFPRVWGEAMQNLVWELRYHLSSFWREGGHAC